MKKLAIIGSGDLANQIAKHAINDNHYQPVGFFDDFESIGTIKNNLPILGNLSQVINEFKKNIFDVVMIGIGYNHLQKREQVFKMLKNNIPFGTIVHSSAHVDKSSKIGNGVIIYPNCTIGLNVQIEDNVLIYNGCNISHDSKVGFNSILSPSVSIAGFSKLKGNNILGIGTIVIDNIQIEKNITTGGGSLVVKNLIEPGLYFGSPTKKK